MKYLVAGPQPGSAARPRMIRKTGERFSENIMRNEIVAPKPLQVLEKLHELAGKTNRKTSVMEVTLEYGTRPASCMAKRGWEDEKTRKFETVNYLASSAS